MYQLDKSGMYWVDNKGFIRRILSSSKLLNDFPPFFPLRMRDFLEAESAGQKTLEPMPQVGFKLTGIAEKIPETMESLSTFTPTPNPRPCSVKEGDVVEVNRVPVASNDHGLVCMCCNAFLPMEHVQKLENTDQCPNCGVPAKKKITIAKVWEPK